MALKGINQGYPGPATAGVVLNMAQKIVFLFIPVPLIIAWQQSGNAATGGNLAHKPKYNPATLPAVTVAGVGPEALRPQLPLRLPM